MQSSLQLYKSLKLQPLDKSWLMSVGEEEITYGSIMHNSHINFTLKVFGDFTWALYLQMKI